MSTHRRTATITGALFILAAITSMAGLLQYSPILDHPDYTVAGPAQAGRVAAGALLEVICAFSVIGISITVFPVLRRYRQGFALGYVCFRLLEATVILVGVISLLSVVTLHQDFARTPDADSSAYLAVGRALVAVHDWTFLVGPNLALAPSTLMMAWFLYRTRAVPRFVALLGVVGGPLIFVSATLVLFGAYQQISTWGALCALPVFAYEMTLAGWLLVKGFAAPEPAPTAAPAPAPEPAPTAAPALAPALAPEPALAAPDARRGEPADR
ncbi:DUF4386 domain-containing protein [Kitasatospora sp. NBC_00374]|uniref:DUF4386 domain-containing protein n=1 Tax=Kitasatospora sp. NBC_00374 TaxID=2975964 RepID=UPI0030E01A24